MKFKTTADLQVDKSIINQIIGQNEGISIIKKAARQRRHVLLIGAPGTGKSMLGQALAELLPLQAMSDILILPNVKDENQPIVKTVKSGKGMEILETAKLRTVGKMKKRNMILLILSIFALLSPWWIRLAYGDIMAAAALVSGVFFVLAFALSLNMSMRKGQVFMPKLLVDSSTLKKAPFVDATGAHAGALLGDVRHDPFQSGGLGTPAHLRVEAGMIHKANKGVLFIDEIATLQPQSQQDLLTAMQEGEYPITGQSEKSAGAMVRTQPVPCNFILIAAGNTDTLERMHPALRSRIRGYGYEVVMHEFVDDTAENRKLYARFVAQEIIKDGKIPHFSKAAVNEILKEAKRRAGRKGKLTLHLRALGGLVRAAGDLALEQGAKLVEPKHVLDAKILARSLEQQVADKYIEIKKEYKVIKTSGSAVGRVNGLAVVKDSGIVLPIEAEVAPGGKKREIVATGKLGKIAREAVDNVSAIIMKIFGEGIKEKYDIYVQFLQTYEGVEGDSASLAVATSIISALKNVPIKQNIAMTGSVSIRGDTLPVGGVTPKVEAAINAGLEAVIVPESNLLDIVLSDSGEKKIKLIPVKNIYEVLEHAIDWKGKQSILKKIKHKK